jgi:hypothetical protein
LLSMLPNIFLLYFQMQGGKFQKREVQKSQGSTGKHKILVGWYLCIFIFLFFHFLLSSWCPDVYQHGTSCWDLRQQWKWQQWGIRRWWLQSRGWGHILANTIKTVAGNTST